MALNQQSTVKGICFILATALISSAAATASKWVASDVPVPMIVLSQYVICLLLSLPWLMGQPLQKLGSKQLKTHLLRGIAGWLCFFSYYAALSKIPLVDAALLRNAAPIFVPLIAWLWVGAIVPVKRWYPVLIGLVGISLILQPGAASVSAGHLFGLLSGVMLAASMVGTRILSLSDNANLILFYYSVISLILSVPLAIIYWQAIPMWTFPYLLLNGAAIFLAMWLYTKAYSYAKPSVISPISYFGVVLSGLMGWLIWGHLPSHTALLGTLVVIAAGLLTLFQSPPPQEDVSVKQAGDENHLRSQGTVKQ